MIPPDEDLNCLLKAWTVPPSPDSLEGHLRSAWRDRTRARSAHWFRYPPGVWARCVFGLVPAAGMFAAAAVIFLLVLAEAFPQSLAGLSGTTAPITVDYEEIEYKADGSSAIRELFASAGGGLVLSSAFPGDPVRTAEQRILDPLNLTPTNQTANPRQTAQSQLASLPHNKPNSAPLLLYKSPPNESRSYRLPWQ